MKEKRLINRFSEKKNSFGVMGQFGLKNCASRNSGSTGRFFKKNFTLKGANR